MSKILDIFSPSKPSKDPELKITIDHREKNSLVVPFLKEINFQIEFKQLPVADYIINGIAIERKTISDLKSSIINKRIFQQLLELKQYPKHLLLIEGIQQSELYQGSLHSNALRGFLLTVALEYQTPMIFTQSENDTAKYLKVLASKKEKSAPSLRPSKILKTPKEQALFILEGFPGIGPASAKSLLNNFGSLKNIFNAEKKELEKIIGKKSSDLLNLLNFTSQN